MTPRMQNWQAGAQGFGAPAPAPQQPNEPRYFTFRFHGDGGSFFMVILKNVLLTIVTLGIYAPWARTNRRKYLWANTELEGQRFIWHGTGKELFFGLLKVIGAYVVLFGIPILVSKLVPIVGLILLVIGYLGMFFLIPFAVYWSRNYLLTRTSWRGIRLGLVPGAGPYAKEFLLGYLFCILTFYIYLPFWVNNLHAIMTNNTMYGTTRFRYDGKGTEVFRIYFFGFLLSMISFGIYSFWMHAEAQRYFASHTIVDGARGYSTLTGGDLFVLTLLNVFGTVFSLGIAFPWIAVFSVRRLLERFSFYGTIDFDRISQGAHSGNAAADGMADMMGVSLGL